MMFDTVPSSLTRDPRRSSRIRGGYEDPLDEDKAGDEVVVTTRRSLIRLALVAAETADRFGRDGIATDPMAWMLAPRRMFSGQAAVDACLGREACVRAILLHALGLGMDADPACIDDLTSDDAGRNAVEEGASTSADPSQDRMPPRAGLRASSSVRARRRREAATASTRALRATVASSARHEP